MRKQMLENAAFEVATQVRTVEESIDSTLLEIAELQARMMRINSVAHVGPAAIHSALTELCPDCAFDKLPMSDEAKAATVSTNWSALYKIPLRKQV